MKLPRIPKSIPYIVVVVASIIMFVMLLSGQQTDRTFPILLFISAKLCIVFSCIELALIYLKLYTEQEDVYRSMSRVISTLGMAMCFGLLIAAFESAR